METLEETTISSRNRFPQNDPVSDIQEDLDLLTIFLRSVLDQFNLVNDPNTSKHLILSHFFPYYFKGYYNFQTIPAISKYKINSPVIKVFIIIGTFHKVFHFKNSRNIPPLIPITQYKDLTLSTKQEMDEYLGTLPSADPDFFHLTRPTTLQATQSTPNTPTQVANTLYLIIHDLPTLSPNLHQSLPSNLTTHDKTIFPRPATSLFSNTSAGLPLAQRIPQTQLQSHQPQISTLKPPISAKTTTVKSSSLKIHLHPTSIPIVRPKLSNPTSSLTANFTKTSNSNSSHSYTIPQPNTMYPSPHHWTTPSNQTPRPSRPTQTPLSTTFNLLVQTHILEPSFQPYTLDVPTCAPLSSRLQIFDGTDYRYRPEQFLKGIKVRTIYQLGPEPTNPDQIHIWNVRRMALVATSPDGPASL